MKLEITDAKENPLLDRKELEFRIEGRTTPSRKEVKGLLASETKSNAELLVIDRMVQLSGQHVVVGQAKVYKTEEALKSTALAHKLKRGVKEAKAEEGGEAPAEKPAEAAPAPAEAETEKPAEEAPKEEAEPEAEAPAEEKPAEEAKEEKEEAAAGEASESEAVEQNTEEAPKEEASEEKK